MTPQEKQARLCALRLLERADRTEAKLRQKLSEKFSPELTEDALAYVKSYGYLDDGRYAQNYIRGQLGQKSRRQILQKLREKGVSSQQAQEAWEEVCREEEPDERALLAALAEKKHARGSALDEKQMRRLLGYLSRRGFSLEEIASVLRELGIHRG